jgi:hypothetical protein
VRACRKNGGRAAHKRVGVVAQRAAEGVREPGESDQPVDDVRVQLTATERPRFEPAHLEAATVCVGAAAEQARRE